MSSRTLKGVRPRGGVKAAIPDKIRDRLIRESEGFTADACWPAFTYLNSGGYGALSWEHQAVKALWLVHRLSYTLFVGPIPEGHKIHHRCENRWCWNPDHLEPLTPSVHSSHHARDAFNVDTCRRGLHPWPESAATVGGHLRCQACYETWRAENPNHRRERKGERAGASRERSDPSLPDSVQPQFTAGV